MDTSLHRDERAIYEAALVRRADRLARLVSLPHGMSVPAVLGMFVGELLRAAVPLCGDELRADLLEWLGRSMRVEKGLCPFCGASKPSPTALMCQACCDAAIADEQSVFLLPDEGEGGRPQ
jgi:hypothetical protein